MKRWKRSGRWAVLAPVVAAVVTLVSTGAAYATTEHYNTEGDAQALLNTYPQTTTLLSRNGGPEQGGVDIRPFAPYYEGEYCVADWHLLALAFFVYEFPDAEPWTPEGGHAFYVTTQYEAQAALDSLESDWYLDDVPVEVTRKPVKVVEVTQETPDPGIFPDVTFGRLWGFQWGRVVAPDELPVGEHTLDVRVTFDGVNFEDLSVTFTVVPLDSAACTG